MADARRWRVLFAGSLAVTGVMAAWSAGAAVSSIAPRAGSRLTQPLVVARPTAGFPCRWRFDLEAGLRTGYVTAANSADCSGRQGSLTLSVRLLRWDPASKAWHTAKVQTKTWRNLGGNRYLELAKPCTVSTVRALFGWTLRNTAGAVVARHSLRTASLKVPGPGCKIGIGDALAAPAAGTSPLASDHMHPQSR
jgi:hypothetical protein